MPKRVVGCLVLLLTAMAAAAQTFAQCDETGSHAALQASMAEHNRQVANMHEKLVTGWYGYTKQGSRVGLNDVLAGLTLLSPRRAGLLFYAFQERQAGKTAQPRLCVWLISPHLEKSKSAAGGVIAVSVALSRERFDRLHSDLVSTLGVIALTQPRATTTLTRGPAQAIGDVREVLLPAQIVDAMLKAELDTLVVLPIGDLGSMPFALLPIDAKRQLVDIAAVTVAPGLFIFEEPPQRARRHVNPLVVGNSRGTSAGAITAPPTPEFANQVEDIRRLVNATAFPSSAVTIDELTQDLSREPGRDFVYIAAHARADAENPLDAGYLLLDKPWTGKTIAKLPLGSARPLVVLTACQSGLGKNFDVGSVGLARAWQQAGASNLVVSLWSVYQQNTAELMREFVMKLQKTPPDIALQRAMIAYRDSLKANRRDDPALWAGFSVFGRPELPASE